MKTYLPQIEPRKIVRPNQTFGILNYDLDNAYPQRMLELVGQSPTATDCWDQRTKYIGGAGFVDEKLGDIIINARGLTLNKLRLAVAADKGLFRGFGIHVNYNANYKIASANFIPFEDIRLGCDNYEKGWNGKYVLYSDWGYRTWKNIYRSRLKTLDKFNSDPEVIKQQVIDAGGWDKWNGQLYYFNPAIDDYPLIKADSVWEDFETEAGIKIFNNRQVTTGFMPAAIIFELARREQADSKPADDGMYGNRPSQMDRDLATFQGARNGQKIMVVEYEDPANIPKVETFQIQNNDKLFEVTEKSVEARIIKGFSIPNALVSSENKGGLADSGAEKKEAIREFNDKTQPDRDEVSKCFAEIFSLFEGIKADQDWSILGIPNDVAEDIIGVRAGVSFNELLLSNIPQENKVWAGVHIYGLSEKQARQIFPVTIINPVDKETPAIT